MMVFSSGSLGPSDSPSAMATPDMESNHSCKTACVAFFTATAFGCNKSAIIAGSPTQHLRKELGLEVVDLGGQVHDRVDLGILQLPRKSPHLALA